MGLDFDAARIESDECMRDGSCEHQITVRADLSRPCHNIATELEHLVPSRPLGPRPEMPFSAALSLQHAPAQPCEGADGSPPSIARDAARQ
jgi:hypothetical protein